MGLTSCEIRVCLVNFVESGLCFKASVLLSGVQFCVVGGGRWWSDDVTLPVHQEAAFTQDRIRLEPLRKWYG